MYPAHGLKQVNRQFLICVSGAVLLVIITIFAGFWLKNDHLFYSYLAVAVGTLLTLLFVGMIAGPVWRYYRYVKSVLTGLKNEVTVMVIDVAKKAAYQNNRLRFYEVTVEERRPYVLKLDKLGREYMESGTERQGDELVLHRSYYYDANLGEPPFAPGNRVTVSVQDHFIIEYKKEG